MVPTHVGLRCEAPLAAGFSPAGFSNPQPIRDKQNTPRYSDLMGHITKGEKRRGETDRTVPAKRRKRCSLPQANTTRAFAGDDETPSFRGASRAGGGDRTEFTPHQIPALDLLLRLRMRLTPAPHARRSAPTTIGRMTISPLAMASELGERLEHVAVPTRLGRERRIGERSGERRQGRYRERRASRVHCHHVVPILSEEAETHVPAVQKDCSWAIILRKEANGEASYPYSV